MYPLFETIRYKNGVAENLLFHQQRVDYTLKQLGANRSIRLAEHIIAHPDKPNSDNNVYKCRFKYDLTGNALVQFESYSIKNIDTITIHDIGQNAYPFKFTDRTWLNEMVSNAGTDEVILSQNGYIKDASYANLVFFDGTQWVTPSQPLLMGTRRASLLKAGIINEAPIQIKDLNTFIDLKFINAMMLWEESILFQLEKIKGQF
jgi:4-amino-4-deoxychorismate lyase